MSSMFRLDRHSRHSPLLAAPVLLAAIWLQISQPLLLTGHLATCAATTACGGSCHHGDQHQAALPASDMPSGDAANDPGGHDGMHCVLCRVLQFAGKALPTASVSDLGSTPLVDRAPPPTVCDRASNDTLDALGPRAPPSC